VSATASETTSSRLNMRGVRQPSPSYGATAASAASGLMNSGATHAHSTESTPSPASGVAEHEEGEEEEQTGHDCEVRSA